MITQQLALPVRPNDTATFNNFLAGPNEIVTAYLPAFITGEIPDQVTYLWGKSGLGKSHLLQAAAQWALAQGKTSSYLSIKNIQELPVQILQGFESYNLICIDDIDNIVDSAEWQEGLFHLYNRLQASGNRLIVSASVPPANLKLELADLRSRLSAAAIFHLHPLSDNEKIEALQLRARARGLELPVEVSQYILSRYSRELPALMDVLEQLDQASLAIQRKLTIPFVKTILKP